MLSARMRFKKSGLGSLFGLGLMLWALPLSAGVQEPGPGAGPQDALDTAPARGVSTQPAPVHEPESALDVAADAVAEPSAEAMEEPSAEAMKEPSAEAMEEPSAEAMEEPSAEAMKEPSADAVEEPSAEAAEQPTADESEPASDDSTGPADEDSAEVADDDMIEPFDDMSELPDEALPETPAEPEFTGDVPDSCALQDSRAVHFTDARIADTLTIAVSDGPCLDARVSVAVTRADGFRVYHHDTPLIKMMPELIYEPEIAQMMANFVERALHRALLRTTGELPEYAEVARYYENTGEFVVVDQARYEELRKQNIPILWHKTGASSWVHVIYDPLTLTSQVIMEGRTF